MSRRPWYKWYPGDYLQDTLHLSLEEDGAYRRLLDWSWTNGPIPDSYSAMGRILRVDTRKAKHLWQTLGGYFDLRGGSWCNKKLEELRGSSERISLIRKEARLTFVGKKQQQNDNKTHNKPDLDPDLDPDLGISRRNTRQNPGFDRAVPFEKIVDLYHRILPELPKVEKLTQARKGFIRQRWLEDLTELDHWENYFLHVRQSKFLMGKIDTGNGRPPFRATLEWLTRPGNFAKVAEEKYHQ